MAYPDDAYTQAIQAGANVHSVYDSRAATYEKLGKLKDALKDSGQVIKIAPTLVQVSDALMHPEQQTYVIL
jgi:F-box/TPR repeat protein Pof3